jgi:16S rRNA (cytosine1402-N4)-methyltransferase
MVREVIHHLGCGPGRTYVDGTIGGAGHSLEILRNTQPNGQVIGIDWDPEAVQLATERLSDFKGRIYIFRDSFTNLDAILRKLNISSVDGIVLDLGLSSYQLESGRGFSFMRNEPLDMRMSKAGITAADLINTLPSKELETILRKYGEEKWSKRIVRQIEKERALAPITTTKKLSNIVRRAKTLKYHPRIHPATKTFQAIRIAVNDELNNLENFIQKGISLLKKGGRICIISYHSLEDRIVKRAYRTASNEKRLHIISSKPITPSSEEINSNPRARSAKLRVAEKL